MASTTSRLFALALLLTLGCSSEEDEAKDNCRSLVSDFCNRIADCAVEAGDIPSSDKSSLVSECATTGESAIGCSKAVGVSDNYDSCMSAIHALTCSDLEADGTVPSECSKVIEVED